MCDASRWERVPTGGEKFAQAARVRNPQTVPRPPLIRIAATVSAPSCATAPWASSSTEDPLAPSSTIFGSDETHSGEREEELFHLLAVDHGLARTIPLLEDALL